MISKKRKEELNNKLDEALFELFKYSKERKRLIGTVKRHKTPEKIDFVCDVLSSNKEEFNYLKSIYEESFNNAKSKFKFTIMKEYISAFFKKLSSLKAPTVFGVNIFLVILLVPIIFISELSKIPTKKRR